MKAEIRSLRSLARTAQRTRLFSARIHHSADSPSIAFPLISLWDFFHVTRSHNNCDYTIAKEEINRLRGHSRARGKIYVASA